MDLTDETSVANPGEGTETVNAGQPEHKLTRAQLLKAGAGALGAMAGAGALANPVGASSLFSAPAIAMRKPSSLNMLYATVEADSDAIKLVLPDFKSEFGFTINLDTMPYDSLQQKVFSELASGSSHYDIMIVDTPWMPALTHKLSPMTTMVTNGKLASSRLQIGDFIPKVFYDTAVYKTNNSHVHYSGPNTVSPQHIKNSGFQIYGLPIQANALTMAYRADLFNNAANKHAFQAKYGKPLRVPQTWAEFTNVAQFFTNPSSRRYGTTLMAGNGDWATDDFKSLLACWGGDGHLVNDKFQPSFNSPAGVAALTYYADLINKVKVTPPGTTAASWDTVATTFGAGLSAITFNYHTVTLNAGVKGAIQYALIPAQVTRGPHFGTWMLSINKYSTNQDWAYRAIEWFTSSAVQKKMLQTQLHPTRRSVYAAAANDPATKKFGDFYTILGKSLEVGVGRPRLKNYADVDHAIWVAVNDVASGRATPRDRLNKAATQVKGLLRKAGYPA